MSGLGRSPRGAEREPSKRNSITSRIFGSLRGPRGDSSGATGLDRRTSSAAAPHASGGGSSSSKQSPVSRIREWLDTCGREHNHHCAISSSAPEAPTFHSSWLIDSNERRLVRAKPGDRYVALSYVWGAPANRPAGSMPPAMDPSWLVKDNVDVFEDALPEDDLPQSVIDAMWVARKLGLRYLWVDRMCVVQDDPQDVEMHVRNAAYVFANAYLTLVAAHGTIHDGLAPIRPKRPGQPPAASRAAPHQELLHRSRWATRGWTLAEGLYARRRVYFFEDAMTWQCHCETWEGSPRATGARGRRRGGSDPCADIVSSSVFAYRHAPWPDLDDYARIVMDYSARRLSSVDDTLRALSPVTNVLSRIYPGGFLYGMPLMFLDVALMWRPQASIRRRAVVRPPFLPSWSWMGWWFDGVSVDLTLWRAAADYVLDTAADRAGKSKRLQSHVMFRVKPTVKWAMSDRASNAPVDNVGLALRDLRSTSRRSGGSSAGISLPPGWERNGSHFRHDSDATTRFKYPVPVEDPPEEGDYPPPPGETAMPGPFLAFRTQSGFFEVDYDATLAPRDADMNPAVAVGNIWARKSRWAGSFRAHDGWLGVQSSNYEGDEAIEFIAISSATERRGSLVFNDEQHQQNVGPDEVIDIVNVLWIERIGGVAYRRGLGHILQKAWDAHPKEDVDILLG